MAADIIGLSIWILVADRYILLVRPVTLQVLGFEAIALAVLANSGRYIRKLPALVDLTNLLLASGLIIALYAMAFSGTSGPVGLTWALLVCATLPFTLLAARRCAQGVLFAAGLWHTPVLVVGHAENMAFIERQLSLANGMGFRIARWVDVNRVGPNIPNGYWREMLRRYNARQLILGFDHADDLHQHVMRAMICDSVPFTVIESVTSLPLVGFHRTTLFSHDVVLTHFESTRTSFRYEVFKTAIDVSVAAAALAFLLPLLLVIALTVLLDGGPIFFAHERVGRSGKRFRCLKFRSMVLNPERVLREHLDANPAAAAEWQATQKLANDPRVTRLGRFLRATSLDELPQFINVLRREMSLVGPRPVTEAELLRYGEDVAYYLGTRPGLTGLWQVSGRNDVSYTRRVELDAWYVRNQTWWHDLVILALTIPAVLKRSGAR